MVAEARWWQRRHRGIPILGFDRLCINAHARAITNAIKVASIAAQSDVVGSICAGLEGGSERTR